MKIRLFVGLALGAVALLLAACGGASSSTQAAATQVSASPPSTGCGSFSVPATQDPDDVLSSLPAKSRSDFRGWDKVRKSTWAAWKPTQAPPYKVVILMGALVNDLQITISNDLRQRLEASQLVGKGNVSVLTTNGVNIPEQIQQMQTAISQHPDLIIVQPTQPAAFLPTVKRAAAAGIPVVTFLGDIDSPAVVNVNTNNYLTGALTASVMIRALGGKGNILNVHGYRTVTGDLQQSAALKSVIKRCPQTKLIGDVDGLYEPATAKSETTKFLATHPASVDGVFQNGGMAQGVMDAFQSVGRPMPLVVDIGAQEGSLGYWLTHRPTYSGAGGGQSPVAMATTVADVALRTLSGQGPVTNAIPMPLQVITDQNITDWAKPTWNLSTAAVTAAGPASIIPDADYLNPLFTNGAPLK